MSPLIVLKKYPFKFHIIGDFFPSKKYPQKIYVYRLAGPWKKIFFNVMHMSIKNIPTKYTFIVFGDSLLVFEETALKIIFLKVFCKGLIGW